MKSEPDRMDLLIVLLPFVLLAVLSFQAYRFVAIRSDRTSGSEIAAEVAALVSRPVEERTVSSSTEPPAPEGEQVVPPNDAAEVASAGAGSPDDGDAVASAEDAGATGPDEAGLPPDEPAETVDDADAVPEILPSAADADEATPNLITSGGPGATPGAGGTALPPAPDPGSASNPFAAEAPGGGSTPVAGALVATPTAAPVGANPSTDAADGGDDPPAVATGGGGGSRRPDDGAGGDDTVNVEKPAIVSAVPSSNTVAVGDVVEVQIRIANGFDVGSVPFHLKFDPAVLQPNDNPTSLRGPFLSVGGYDTQFLVAPGPGGDEMVVGLSLMGATEGPKGSGLLATLYFKAVAPGTSMLRFTRASVRGADARTLPAMFQPTVIKVE